MQKAPHIRNHVLKIIARQQEQQEQQRKQVGGKSSENQSLSWRDSEEEKRGEEEDGGKKKRGSFIQITLAVISAALGGQTANQCPGKLFMPALSLIHLYYSHRRLQSGGGWTHRAPPTAEAKRRRDRRQTQKPRSQCSPPQENPSLEMENN